MKQRFVDAPKFAEREFLTAELGGQRRGDDQIANESDGSQHDVFVVELETVGASQYIHDGSKLHVADMADLCIWVQGKVAIVTHHRHVCHGDGASAAWVAICIAERPHLMKVVFLEGEVGLTVEYTQRRLSEGGIWGRARAIGVSKKRVAHMTAGEGPVVFGVTLDPLDAARQMGVVSAL